MRHPTKLDQELVMDLVELGESMSFNIASGKTLCTNDFYEGQGRLDGAFCDYTQDDKMSYLQKLNCAGVKNIEMESEAFAALTHRAGIRAAVICVALLNRLNGDQVRQKSLSQDSRMDDWDVLLQCFLAVLRNISPDHSLNLENSFLTESFGLAFSDNGYQGNNA